jgi:hypothetical protein
MDQLDELGQTRNMPSQYSGTSDDRSAGERAAASKDAALEGAKDVVASGQEHAKQLAGTAMEQVRTVMDRTMQEARTQGDEQARRAASTLRTTSQQLKALSEGRPQDAGPVADLLSTLTDQMSAWAGRLEGGADVVLRDMARFARRRPGAFLGLAALAGFATGRLVRAAAATSSSSSSMSSNGRQALGSSATYGSSTGGLPYGTSTAAPPYGTSTASMPSGSAATPLDPRGGVA